MNRDEFEKMFDSMSNGVYDFYRNFLYHMGSYPMLFWALMLLSVCGLLSIFFIVGMLL